uniref:Putative salivary lipocalin n=1 Tax=Ixodes ricinus TaxID=34613 RepID=A0A6B0V3T6_IXORI
MKTFFSLIIAALYGFVKCSPECSCPSLGSFLLRDAELNIFRDPWPFLRSPDRLYLKYIPFLEKFRDIACVISDFIRMDSQYHIERKVSWTNLSTTASIRYSINVTIQEVKKSKTEFSVIYRGESYDFETVFADFKCLIIRISRTQAEQNQEGTCLLWVKEKYLENPLRHCSFFYYIFCQGRYDDLKPKKGCDRNIKEKDTNAPTTGGNHGTGDTRPPR